MPLRKRKLCLLWARLGHPSVSVSYLMAEWPFLNLANVCFALAANDRLPGRATFSKVANRRHQLSVCGIVKRGFFGSSGTWFSTKSAWPLPDGVRELISQNVIREVSFGSSGRFRLA